MLHWHCQTISTCVSRKNKCSSVCAQQHQRRCEVNKTYQAEIVMSSIFDVKRVQHISPISFRMSSYWVLQLMIYIPCQNSVPIQKVERPLLVRRIADNRCVRRNDFYTREQSSSPISDRRINVGFYKRTHNLSHPLLYNFAKKNQKKNQYCPVV